MQMLISQLEFDSKKSRDKIPLECYQCKKTHYRCKNLIQRILNGNLKNTNKGCFCSKECKFESQKVFDIYNCKFCQSKIKRIPSSIQSNNIFCNNSCSAKYNNTHKTHGTRRSKLEVWIETQIKKLFPNLEIHFNKKDTINSELDIYIPSLKFAVELNGIFHYEPIYSINKLNQIKNNDDRKFQACLERGIELCIIDTSKLKYFKENTSTPVLDIITNIIYTKLEPHTGNSPVSHHYK